MIINKKTKKIVRLVISIGAAALLIFAGVIGYDFYRLSPEFLYNQQYTSFTLAGRDTTPYDFSPIEKSFAEGKYKTVLELKKKAPDIPINEYFFCGVSYLELNDPFNAIHCFQSEMSNDKMPGQQTYKDETEFYLALAYLKNRDYDQALELMKAIHNNPAHRYHQRFSDRFIHKVKILKWR